MSIASRTHKGALSRAFALVVLVSLIVSMVPLASVFAVAPRVAVSTPTTYWVDDDGSDDNLGTEAEPFKTIKHAFDVAGNADTVMVKPGTYDAANGETFPLMAYGTELISTDGADVTIIQGDGANRILHCDWMLDGDRIAGFTFTGGYTAGASGAAIYHAFNAGPMGDPDTPVIEDNVFVGNDAHSGGALFLGVAPGGKGFPLVRNNEFRDNMAFSNGGAILVTSYSSATIEDNLFVGNEADHGGAIYAATTDSTQTITGNVFRDNDATVGLGGAIYMSLTGGQYHKIHDNVFDGNFADSTGGALWLYGGNFEVFNNDASDNEAGSYGGFGYAQFSSVESENNVIRGCTSGNAGAAWYVDTAALYLRNETIFNNTGLVAAVDALVTDTLNVDNSILWNPGSPADVVNADRLEYSCVYDVTASGTGVIHGNPGFANPLGGDGRLGGGSPCIDSGDGTHSAPVDFFGTARPVDGDGVGGAGYDMGYHEYVPPATERLSDRTRYSTAVAIAEESFPAWTDVTDVVIASGDDRAAADPLAASGLCWAYDAPMFLVGASKPTPQEVKVAIKQIVDANGPVTLHVVGGPVSVPDARIGEIKSYVGAANVASERLLATGGRYDLARAIAKRMKSVAAADPDKTLPDIVLFANGADSTKFFDALALSPIAAAQGAPILLVKADSIPAATTAAISDLGNPPTRIVGGGKYTVSESVRSTLGATRWSGRSRYDTAIAIANGAVGVGWLNRQTVGIAAKLPDALTGGAFVGRRGGVLLLTDGSVLTTATKNWLLTYKAQVLDCYVFGGEFSVTAGVKTAIANALK